MTLSGFCLQTFPSFHPFPCFTLPPHLDWVGEEVSLEGVVVQQRGVTQSKHGLHVMPAPYGRAAMRPSWRGRGGTPMMAPRMGPSRMGRRPRMLVLRMGRRGGGQSGAAEIPQRARPGADLAVDPGAVAVTVSAAVAAGGAGGSAGISSWAQQCDSQEEVGMQDKCNDGCEAEGDGPSGAHPTRRRAKLGLPHDTENAAFEFLTA